MESARLVFSFFYRLLRLFLNAVDPYLSRIGIRIVEKPPETVEELLNRISVKWGTLPTFTSNRLWQERLQSLLYQLKLAPSRGVTPFEVWVAYKALLAQVRALYCLELIPRQFPAISIPSVSRPIFVFGLPRSRSTLLIRFLSLHPNVFCLPDSLSQLGEITPDDVKKATSIDDLRRRVQIALRDVDFKKEFISDSGSPIAKGIHPLGLSDPEECPTELNKYLLYYHLPFIRGQNFIDAVTNYDDLVDRTYASYKRDLLVMRSISDSPEVASDKRTRFVLKAPFHSSFSDAILHHFPDACFVRVHRDPATSIASLASLVLAAQTGRNRNDSFTIGRQCYELIGTRIRAMVSQKSATCTVDVKFNDIARDPVGVCRTIANQVGLEYTNEMHGNLSAFLKEEEARRSKGGKRNVTTLSDFGLDAAQIRDDYSEYCQRFGL